MKRFACALACVLCLAPAARSEVVEGVAAIVGDEVILLSEVRDALQGYAARIRAAGETINEEDAVKLRQSALQTLIDDRLVVQIAKKQNMAATEEEIDESVAGIAKQENVAVEAIYAAAAQQGLEKKTYREQLGKQITRMKIVQGAVQGKVRVSDADVKKLYEDRYGHAKPGERIRVLHILLGVAPDAKDEKRAEAHAFADKLREQAKAEGNFESLARKFSTAPTAQQGGLTVFRVADAPADIKAAIQSLGPGEISEVIDNRNGANVFQFLDRFDPADVPFEKVADRLRAELIEQRTMPEFEKWIADVRKSRYIEVVAPELRE
jgi:parvulin-like peptidyl-prolyl isomerase